MGRERRRRELVVPIASARVCNPRVLGGNTSAISLVEAAACPREGPRSGGLGLARLHYPLTRRAASRIGVLNIEANMRVRPNASSERGAYSVVVGKERRPCRACPGSIICHRGDRCLSPSPCGGRRLSLRSPLMDTRSGSDRRGRAPEEPVSGGPVITLGHGTIPFGLPCIRLEPGRL